MGVKELASLFMVTPRRVQQLAADGVVVKGKDRGMYQVRASIQGYIQFLEQSKARPVVPGEEGKQLNLLLEQYRLTKAKADREEMRAAELKGELIHAAQVEDAWQEVLGMLRTRLLEIPTAVAPEVYDTETVGEITQILREKLHDVLRILGSLSAEAEECVFEANSSD